MLNLPAGTVRKRFGVPGRVVLYVQAKPGEREACRLQVEGALRQLRKLSPGEENDFSLSTADQIIATVSTSAAMTIQCVHVFFSS